MIEIDLFYNTFLIAFVIIFAITVCINIFRKERKYSLFFVGIIEMYIIMLLKVVILPIRIIYDESYKSVLIDNFDIQNALQLIPFYSIHAYIDNRSWIPIIGNLILLIPMVFILLFMKKSYLFTFIFSSLFSLGIEIVQFLIVYITKFTSHISDIDDIILNCIGIICGMIFFWLLKKINKLYQCINTNVIFK